MSGPTGQGNQLTKLEEICANSYCSQIINAMDGRRMDEERILIA